MKIHDIKIGTKQAIAFGLILALMGLAGIVTLISMQSIKASIDRSSEIWLPRAITISNLSLYTSDLRRQQIQLTITQNEALQDDLKQEIITTMDRINAARDRYEQLREKATAQELYTERERELYDSFDRQWEEYQDLTLAWIILLRDEGEREASRILDEDARQRAQSFRDDLQQLVEISTEEAQLAANEADLAYERTQRLTRILMIIAVGLSVVFIITLINLISRPVKKLADAACRIAGGDLDVRLESSGMDEVGILSQSFNQMASSLRDARTKTEKQEAELRRQNAELQNALLQLKQAQQQLLLKEKMASLGQLVAGIAHEINNPVGAVNSSSDSSRRVLERLSGRFNADGGTNPQLDPDSMRLLDALKESNGVITMAGERIAKIVRSLKNFARLDEAEYQSADLHQGIDSTLTLLHHELKNRIEIIKDYGEIPLVQCYPNQLNQVFMNLFINAAQAIEGEGTITIATRHADGIVEVSVSDTGRGIARKNLDLIFDPGFTTKGVGVGTGLGLSISYNIIKKHEGEISVASEVGKGSTFTIKLPVNPKSKEHIQS